MIVSLDFETRSTVELKATGVYPYAKHADTSLWCMAYAFDDEEPELWVPGMPFPERLLAHIRAGGEVRAWNAQFERVMWQLCARRLYPDWPDVALEQWVDTAAEAAAMALPRSLDQCAKVTGVPAQKDSDGYNLMLRMCRPRKVHADGRIEWWEVQEGTKPKEVAEIKDRQRRLFNYCKQDVRTERALAKVLRRLSPVERETYLLDQRINDRGVLLDRPLALAAREIVSVGTERANQQVAAITEGAVPGITKRNKLVAWLKSEGVETDSVGKAALVDLLASDLPPNARAVLEVRQEAAKSSTAKIESMLAVADPDDDRLRGLLLYHAASTGRWAGRNVQPHNFPRGEIKDIERYIELVREGKDAYDLLDCLQAPLPVVSSMLRSMLIAKPGHCFLVGDYSAIEARMLNWLAGQDDYTALFRAGVDVYRHNAAHLYRILIQDVLEYPHRQVGKFQELGCGYQMGWRKALTALKDTYGVDLVAELGKEEAEKFVQAVVNSYRDRHPFVVDYWHDCEGAAMRAVENPGTVEVAGAEGRQVKFVVKGKYLWLILPSGRPLCYAAPKIVDKETPWGEVRPCVQAWAVNSLTRKWEPRAMYGGLWVENIVQAASRDVLRDAMLRLEAHGYPCVLTVHDEIVVEAPVGFGSVAEFQALMEATEPWARGCPINVKAWEGERYKKA